MLWLLVQTRHGDLGETETCLRLLKTPRVVWNQKKRVFMVLDFWTKGVFFCDFGFAGSPVLCDPMVVQKCKKMKIHRNHENFTIVSGEVQHFISETFLDPKKHYMSSLNQKFENLARWTKGFFFCEVLNYNVPLITASRRHRRVEVRSRAWCMAEITVG